MHKTYVLDTSALIQDPFCYKQFKNSDVVIPISVLNELDKLKKQPAQAGRNARVAIRGIDEISDLGDISVGIIIENDIVVKVDTHYIDLYNSTYTSFGDPSYGDTQILATLHYNWVNHPTNDVCLVSNDINLRVKAKARGIEAISNKEKYDADDLYSGLQIVKDEVAGLDLQQGFIDPRAYGLNLNTFSPG